MGFFDSQIFGVIVGAAIGGIGKYVHEVYTKNQLCENLERGIKAEIKVIRDSVVPTWRNLEGYLRAIESGGQPDRKYRSLPESTLSFTEANLDKIGILDKGFLEPLIEVKATLQVLPKALGYMWDTHDRFINGGVNRDLLIDQLNVAVATFKKMEENSEKLLAHEKNYSTLDTLWRYARNRWKKLKKH